MIRSTVQVRCYLIAYPLLKKTKQKAWNAKYKLMRNMDLEFEGKEEKA